MKVNSIVILAGLIAAVITAGCATTGYKSAEKSTLSMEKTKQELVEAKYQTTATFTALDNLLNAKSGDLLPLQKEFAKEVRGFQKLAEDTRPKAVKMRDQSQAYFANWANEINLIGDPTLKAQSSSRRDAAMKSYAGIEKDMTAIRDAYWPIFHTLDDINKAITTDLTPAGINTVRSTAASARQNAVALQKMIDEAVKSINSAAGKLAPVASAP